MYYCLIFTTESSDEKIVFHFLHEGEESEVQGKAETILEDKANRFSSKPIKQGAELLKVIHNWW